MNNILSTSETNEEAAASSSSTATTTSPLWKISSGKNGEKYLTFAGKQRQQQTLLDSDNPAANSNINDDEPIQICVYKMRWYILACICFAQIANSINWICYSPIADFTGQFYSVSYNSVNYLSLSYLIITIPTGFFSFWIADNFGIRSSINAGVWLNLLGAILKALSSLDSASGVPLIKQVIIYILGVKFMLNSHLQWRQLACKLTPENVS